MSRAEQLAAEMDERVAGWRHLSPDEREALLREQPVDLRTFKSGGAMLTLNGVDRFFPSRADALAEFEARNRS